MTTLLKDIKSNNWQISTAGVGLVAEGLADIRQCLDIILRTTKGTDPLRPEFGSDVYKYTDRPLTIAIPNIIRAVIEAVGIWEKRVVLQSVTYEIANISNVRFFVTYRLVDSELIDQIKLIYSDGFLANEQVVTQPLIIYAVFPSNPDGKRYKINLQINGLAALPLPPAIGFDTLANLYAWVVANYSGFGYWQLGADRLTGFLNANISDANVSISLSNSHLYTASILDRWPAQKYKVQLTANDEPQVESIELNNTGEIISWLNANWAQYGEWSLIVSPPGAGDFDSEDFDPGDFDTVSYSYVLALQSETVLTATLNVAII